MPFIPKENRKVIKEQGFKACKQVGDLCYVVYIHMISEWGKNPRWTTAHDLKQEFVICPIGSNVLQHLFTQSSFTWSDVLTASHLAYDVFFTFKVVDYERRKQIENGGI